MTECEVCGAEIKGAAQYVVIGDSKLRVCKACAHYGTVVVENKNVRAGPMAHAKANSRLYEQMDHDLEVEVEEDYGRKLKEAREKAGLKQTELANRINEKQSLVRKIENEEIVPSDEVMRKITRVLYL
ncbi:TIGR00270 family protein [ANME-1 cluster archaeon AG-394-G06]|nr:TIGR00270 family protein [ANME-1 cluster archaeon AG-394-G06]